jgi:hypothetical protein
MPTVQHHSLSVLHCHHLSITIHLQSIPKATNERLQLPARRILKLQTAVTEPKIITQTSASTPRKMNELYNAMKERATVVATNRNPDGKVALPFTVDKYHSADNVNDHSLDSERCHPLPPPDCKLDAANTSGEK